MDRMPKFTEQLGSNAMIPPLLNCCMKPADPPENVVELLISDRNDVIATFPLDVSMNVPPTRSEYPIKAP
jgi:hypothetical protein